MSYGDNQHVAGRLKSIGEKLFPGGPVPDPWHGWQDDMSFLHVTLEDRKNYDQMKRALVYAVSVLQDYSPVRLLICDSSPFN